MINMEIKQLQRDIEALTAELISLPKRERLEIVRFLLFLDNKMSDTNNVDSEWEEEIVNRIHEVDNGKAVGIDFNEAKLKIEKQYNI